MIDFPFNAGGYQYRALRKRRKRQEGWDVFALQTALAGLKGPIAPDLYIDGIFGPETKDAVKKYQRRNGLIEDGIAGIATQRDLALRYVKWNQRDLPDGLLQGQVEHESSYLLGNYTPPYPDGNRDCGVVQRNSKYTAPAEGFHVPASIDALADRVSAKHALYAAYNIVSPRRAWELAAGSWNAPSWTDWLARGKHLGPNATAHIEAYIDDVTVYMDFDG